MKAYKNTHWKTVPCWFNYPDFYDQVLDMLQDGAVAVELGTWLGASTCYFAQGIKESGKKIKFFACDLFLAPGPQAGEYLKQCPDLTNDNFYSKFLDNIRRQGVEDIVIPVKVNSLDFALTFEDKSVDFLFIDDLHEEEHVYKELLAWYPKLKDKAILAGHDVCFFEIQRALARFTQENSLSDYRASGSCWLIDLK